MAPRTIIISAADAPYWPLLSGMLNSVDRGRKAANFDVGILDLGLLPDQLARLRSYGASVLIPQWDYDISRFPVNVPKFFKAMTARPRLTSYFPGYDVYIWLDADCWVQDWRAIEMLVLAAQNFDLAAVPEVDRSYDPYFKNGVFFEWNYNCFSSCFGAATAEKWKYYPTINSGVFAASSKSKLWEFWPAYLARALDAPGDTPSFIAEQTAFNVAIRAETIPIAFLPARLNWVCNRAMPRLSFDGRLFVEPSPPFEPIGVIHMAAQKGGPVGIYDLGGQLRSVSLEYPPLA
jgi:lipopolysaccharide biosynthesis glycosyltransferase